jgi:hypothetical protein
MAGIMNPAMIEVPVARRTYFHGAEAPAPDGRQPCPACGRRALEPWYLRRDRQRRVWRRWVCTACQTAHDLPEDASA